MTLAELSPAHRRADAAQFRGQAGAYTRFVAPSDDDDQRVPDTAASDSDARKLPTGAPGRSIGSGRREGIDPRPSGSVVFDVEVDDPSLVMPRPTRRARTKAVDEDDDDEIVDGETVDEPAQLAAGDDGAADDRSDGGATEREDERHDDRPDRNDTAHDDDHDTVHDDGHDDDHDDDSHEVLRPLVSGDPLLTGPVPAVRRSTRGARAEPASPPVTSDAEVERADASPPATKEEPETTQPAPASTEAEGGEAPESSSTPTEPAPPKDRADKPSLTPRDLFEPVTGEQRAVPAESPPAPVPPAPVTGRVGSVPPPPPAPSLAGGTPAPGVMRPSPPGAPPPAEPARRASRGSQVTGQTATTTMRPVDPSGPVATQRPTAVAPAPRLAGRRPRVRRVTRVVRHVDPWSVFKVAAVFSFVAYGIALVAGVLLWNVAYATGTIDNIERGLESTGWETFELNGGEIFHNAWIGGLFAAVGLTGLAVLVATLFNLITDLVGGVRMTVLEEEVVEKTGSPMRRFSSRQAPNPVAQATSRRR